MGIDLRIAGGDVVLPGGRRRADVLVEDGKIAGIVSPGLEVSEVGRTVDATGRLVLPGMVDPHVHFHVIPRYARAQRFEETELPDTGWPGQPNLAAATTLAQEAQTRLRDALRRHWPKD